MASNGNSSLQHHDKESLVQPDVAPIAPSSEAPTSASANTNLSKDEVGWYFVEQYYTTLSKSPEKLHVRSIFSPSPKS